MVADKKMVIICTCMKGRQEIFGGRGLDDKMGSIPLFSTEEEAARFLNARISFAAQKPQEYVEAKIVPVEGKPGDNNYGEAIATYDLRWTRRWQ